MFHFYTKYTILYLEFYIYIFFVVDKFYFFNSPFFLKIVYYPYSFEGAAVATMSGDLI